MSARKLSSILGLVLATSTVMATVHAVDQSTALRASEVVRIPRTLADVKKLQAAAATIVEEDEAFGGFIDTKFIAIRKIVKESLATEADKLAIEADELAVQTASEAAHDCSKRISEW